VFVLDPMLATGGSAVAALDLLAERQVRGPRLLCILAAPRASRAWSGAHPDVEIILAASTSGSISAASSCRARRRGRPHLRHALTHSGAAQTRYGAQ
jgi:hypothetical protein